MFRKVAIALLTTAALAAPVMAQTPPASSPAAPATQNAAPPGGAKTAGTTTVGTKTAAATVTHRKHVRHVHVVKGSKHLMYARHMKPVKTAHHGKRGIVAQARASAGAKHVSAKPATKSSTN